MLEAPETATDAQRSYVEPEPADLEPQDVADPTDDDRSNVVPLRAIDTSEDEQRTIEGLKAEIRRLSRRLGVPVEL